MNPDFPPRLAAQLRANPSFLEEMDDILLSELVCHYYEGELDAKDAVEVEALLQTNPKAKAIYQRIEAADRFATSPAGKTWLESLRNHVLPSLTDSPQAAAALAAGRLLKTATAWLKEHFTLFDDFPQFEVGTAGDAVFVGDSPSEAQNQRVMNLVKWYEEADLTEKLPWAAHRVVLQKVPIKSKPGMVRYRALVEKRGGAATDTGMLRIALQAAEQADEITLQADMRSKTFQKAVLPGDAPVAFKPILE